MLKVIVAFSLVFSQASAGELSRRDIRRTTDWDSTNCYKPYEPSFYIHDVDSFNQAVEEFNNYLYEIETYIDCVNAEASDDFQTLKRILEDSLDEKTSEAQRELGYVRDSLESQRPY